MLLFAAAALAQTPDPHQLFLAKLSDAAIERTQHSVRYDPKYVAIPYPNGDVPEDTGVCTDEVIRSYRAVGIDLQKEVHEDMVANLKLYPAKTRTRDKNIAHRRVPNLMVFFGRKGEILPRSKHDEDYLPGEIVAWDLGGGLTHIGIVVDQKSRDGHRYLVMHNIGEGPKLEDVLFAWKIIGHYRYYGPLTSSATTAN